MTHPAIDHLRAAAATHSRPGSLALSPRETFTLGLTEGALFASACSAFFAVLRGAPAPTGGIGEILDAILEKVNHMDKNLDQVSGDWAELKPLLQSRLTTDADTIAKLTGELLDAAKSSTPLPDDRAAQLHAEMQDAIASLRGSASAVGSTPGVNTGVAGSAGATGATGSASAGQAPAPGASPAASPGAAGTVTVGAQPNPPGATGA